MLVMLGLHQWEERGLELYQPWASLYKVVKSYHILLITLSGCKADDDIGKVD